MEIRTEKKLVEIMQSINTYIAVDGKEFDNKIDCENYEKELESAKLRAEAEVFELKELEDVYPLDARGGEVPENHCYKWYKVNNTEELNKVANLYNADFGEFKDYPQTICIEYDYHYDEYRWIYTLSDMQRQTIEFWEKHGFDVEFKTR